MKINDILQESNETKTEIILTVDDHFSIDKLKTLGKKHFCSTKGSINISNKDLDEFPCEFGIIEKDFICEENYLTSLEGGPIEVGKAFIITDNKLTSLKGSPKSVGWGFGCDSNLLENLIGISDSIGSWIDISNNKLNTLNGFTIKHVKGEFTCSNNKLTSLKYGPEIVDNDYQVSENEINTLEFLPKVVGGSMILEKNKLTSLVGIHKLKSCTDIYLSKNNIVEGGIGLILIEGLQEIDITHDSSDFGKAMRIIGKYLRHGKKSLLKCSEELEEAGLGAFAKL